MWQPMIRLWLVLQASDSVQHVGEFGLLSVDKSASSSLGTFNAGRVILMSLRHTRFYTRLHYLKPRDVPGKNRCNIVCKLIFDVSHLLYTDSACIMHRNYFSTSSSLEKNHYYIHTFNIFQLFIALDYELYFIYVIIYGLSSLLL